MTQTQMEILNNLSASTKKPLDVVLREQMRLGYDEADIRISYQQDHYIRRRLLRFGEVVGVDFTLPAGYQDFKNL